MTRASGRFASSGRRPSPTGGRSSLGEVLLQQGLPLPSLALPPAWRFAASSPGGKHPLQAACARSFLAALGRSCDDRFRRGATRAMGLRGRGRSHVMWHSVLSERRRKFHMSRLALFHQLGAASRGGRAGAAAGEMTLSKEMQTSAGAVAEASEKKRRTLCRWIHAAAMGS
ncbi:unnamed protein product [Effrenium voratum]|nr:unnamed protein product [Effrenium voratum]